MGSVIVILLLVLCLILIFTLLLHREGFTWENLYQHNKQVFSCVLTSTKPSIRIAVIILLAMAGLGIALSLIGIVLTFLS